MSAYDPKQTSLGANFTEARLWDLVGCEMG